MFPRQVARVRREAKASRGPLMNVNSIQIEEAKRLLKEIGDISCLHCQNKSSYSRDDFIKINTKAHEAYKILSERLSVKEPQ